MRARSSCRCIASGGSPTRATGSSPWGCRNTDRHRRARHRCPTPITRKLDRQQSNVADLLGDPSFFVRVDLDGFAGIVRQAFPRLPDRLVTRASIGPVRDGTLEIVFAILIAITWGWHRGLSTRSIGQAPVDRLKSADRRAPKPPFRVATLSDRSHDARRSRRWRATQRRAVYICSLCAPESGRAGPSTGSSPRGLFMNTENSPLPSRLGPLL